MSLFRVSIELEDLAAARELTERLTDLVDPPPSATSYFEDRETRFWRVDAYMDIKPDTAQLRVALDLPDGTRLSVEDVPDENWVALSQAALPPVFAGRVIVHGSHDRARIGRRLGAIEIDAGEAFGTAHHATTEGCLIAIDRLSRRQAFRRVLDLGCGSGVLAIAAARLLPGARVVASDFDPVAAGVTHANIRVNRVGGQVSALAAPGLDAAPLRGRAQFDLVFANILAGPVIAMAPAVRAIVAPQGLVVLSGLLTEQAREVLGTYLALGFTLEQRIVLSGWSTLVLKRRGRPPGPPSLNGGTRAPQKRQARGVKSSRVRTLGSSSWSMPMSLRTWSSKAASSARSAHWA